VKHKYVEERFPRWFEFGAHPDGAHVDIADTDGDVFQHVPAALASEIMRARNAFVDELIRIFEVHPDACFTFQRKSL
jgi:hypothetical protein